MHPILFATAACAMLAALSGLASRGDAVSQPGVTPEPRPIVDATPAPVARRDVDGQARIALVRPLFNAGRRPVAAGAPPDAPATPIPRLTALLSGPFGRRAILTGTEGRSQTVAEGASIASWTVVEITANGVVLLGQAGAQTVTLARSAGAPPPAPSADVDEHESSAAIRLPTRPPIIHGMAQRPRPLP